MNEDIREFLEDVVQGPRAGVPVDDHVRRIAVTAAGLLARYDAAAYAASRRRTLGKPDADWTTALPATKPVKYEPDGDVLWA